MEKSLGQKILDLYVYGSFHIALSASLFTLYYFQYLESTNWWYILFVFCSSWVVYSAHKAVGIVKVKAFENEGRFKVISLYRNHIFVYIGLGLIGCLITWLQLASNLKLWVISLSIIPIIYVLPIFKGRKRLRDYGLIKIFLIAIVWAIISTSFPLIDIEYLPLILLSFSAGLYILGITIPFDIRDLVIEESLDVKTIPSVFGISKSKLLSYTCFISSGILALLVSIDPLAMAFSVSCLISILLVYNFSEKENDFYFSLLLDGTMMLPFILYWGIKMLSY